MKKVYKYGTGQEIPKDAKYLCSLKNGVMSVDEENNPYYFVWHYFLVEVKNEKPSKEGGK